ncbi:MAG: radical SAM protein [Thermodesulfovibrionales bacterium]|nr:radical SAM protein [Thermodesulfovibrionales bacterium]
MKILLIYPYFLDKRIKEEDVSSLPIGMYYLGAILRENNYNVEILNWYNLSDRKEEIIETLIEKRPDVIGFSIVNANRWGAIDIAKIAKRILPHVKILCGGVGATFLWEHLLKYFKEIDYIVLREGEYTLLRLLQYIEGEKIDSLHSIKGIAFCKDGKIIRTDPTELIDNIDSLPIPSKHFTYQHVISSRGCLYNCSFCGSPQFWARRVRFHSVRYFVEQLQQLYERGISFFYVSDDTFTINSKRVIEICKKIIDNGLKINWYAISRVNFIDEEMLYWMRKAGCIQISYGVESGSEKIRQKLNKSISTKDIKRAFELTKRYGILPRAYFIYGAPGEDDQTIKETLDLMREIKPLSTIFYILDIFPGTALYDDFRTKNNVKDEIWLERVEDIPYFTTDESLSQEKILDFGRILRMDFYKNLPSFVKHIELINKQDLFQEHADFLTRLAMTFSHGDYSVIDAIPEKEKIAEELYNKALSFFPNQFAYLGLGIIKQKQGKYAESLQILHEGLIFYPDSEHLLICLGISYMNLGQFEKAIEFFLRCGDSKVALTYAIYCYKALGDSEKETLLSHKLRSLQNSPQS